MFGLYLSRRSDPTWRAGPDCTRLKTSWLILTSLHFSEDSGYTLFLSPQSPTLSRTLHSKTIMINWVVSFSLLQFWGNGILTLMKVDAMLNMEVPSQVMARGELTCLFS